VQEAFRKQVALMRSNSNFEGYADIRKICLDVRVPDALSIWDKTMRTRYLPFCADNF
jgi:hypothetical protein